MACRFSPYTAALESLTGDGGNMVDSTMRAPSLMLVLLVAACSADRPSPKNGSSTDSFEEESASSAEEAAEDDAAPHEAAHHSKTAIPTSCASNGERVCTPPPEFVDKLCMSGDPNVALAMF